jgi:EAL domain-containing protein (putative c-di-GMP-specific phosphodiesterase class I)
VLKTAPLDQLKIDVSLVRGLTKDRHADAVVKAIISMAEALGLQIVAEGVETEAQLEFLMRHGWRNFQGYLFRELQLEEGGLSLPEHNGDLDLACPFIATA